MNYHEKLRLKQKEMAEDAEFGVINNKWLLKSVSHSYAFNFNWLGFPIIQYPQDIIAMQEIVWKIKPDLIIETGVYHGGSLVFYASILELIDSDAKIIGIDINLNHKVVDKLKESKAYNRIELISGSSISRDVYNKVLSTAKDKKKVIVCLDSNHSHEHVLKELELYSPLVSKDGYLVVMDTFLQNLPDDTFKNYDKKDNPKTAVWKFLEGNDRFKIDKEVENKLLITANPDGFLRPVY